MSASVRFGATVAASTVALYLLMYLDVYRADPVLFSQTRVYMALIMGAGMAAIMLPFMHETQADRRRNMAASARASPIRGCASSPTASSRPSAGRSGR